MTLNWPEVTVETDSWTRLQKGGPALAKLFAHPRFNPEKETIVNKSFFNVDKLDTEWSSGSVRVYFLAWIAVVNPPPRNGRFSVWKQRTPLLTRTTKVQIFYAFTHLKSVKSHAHKLLCKIPAIVGWFQVSIAPWGLRHEGMVAGKQRRPNFLPMSTCLDNQS
jgi:hypothetical protein